MGVYDILLPVTLCLLLSISRCPAQDDSLSLTLPNGRVLHFESEEQKQKFEAGRAAQAARLAATPTPTVAPATPEPSLVLPPLPGTPPVNTSAPTFTSDYYGLPKSGAWNGRKVTLAVAYVRQQSEDGSTPVKFTARTWNGRPGAAGSHMEGGYVTLVATEGAARKLVVQCGTDFRYTAAGMTITMLHGVVQPLEGGKGYGIFVDY